MNTSLYKKRREGTRATLLWIAATIIGVVIVWLIIRATVGPRKESLPLGAAATIYNTLLPKRALVSRITELETTLQSYTAELTTARLLAQENDQLKAELSRGPHTAGTLAHVVTLPNRSIYDTFVIDAGANEQMAVGQVVYAFGSIALGTISDVADDHATVTLFGAANREVSGSVGADNVTVTLIGRGGGEYEVRLPRDLAFSVGDLVSYQSTHPSILASIERIITDPRDPFQRLIAKTPINLQALKWVIVR